MRVVVAALLAACSQPAKPACDPTTPSLCNPTQLQTVPPAPPPLDAHGPSQDEKLAAIQKAMNELDEAAQLCWAMAATERFDIEGEIALMIEITAVTGAGTASVVRDTARNKKLSTCLVQLLGGYRWAPPLHGDTIQLPFAFKAPDGQSVIDRKLVEWKGQDKVSLAVLLDENNTGNAAASMFELKITAAGSTGARVAERDEVWYFHSAATVRMSQRSGTAKSGSTWGAATSERAEAGDMMFVPRGSVRDVRPLSGAELDAVVAVFPGGREGTARAGAMPTPPHTETRNAPGVPILLSRKNRQPHGPATIFIEASTVKGTPCSASILALAAGAKVPEHVHAGETELLYILEGSGTMTIAGQDIAVTATSVVQIPPGTKHAFVATENVSAVQLYTPPGPEQRFKKAP